MFLVLRQDGKHGRLNGVLVEWVAFLLVVLGSDRANGRDVGLDPGLFFWGLRIFERQEPLKALDGVEQDVEELRADQRAA